MLGSLSTRRIHPEPRVPLRDASGPKCLDQLPADPDLALRNQAETRSATKCPRDSRTDRASEETGTFRPTKPFGVALLGTAGSAPTAAWAASGGRPCTSRVLSFLSARSA